ncbi:glycosyl hydrolase 115 family protein [Jeotgalibaca caeni]|uniref:glycosyl hydrolase 115 family protein n=1 Tax=Jeotgalibaca caeni TaxID=3028623 RepID=UPI00237E49D6|nr:glycosyl hydrolase 115 family protein [Jeotgalibaca caeni]MDE1547598.1 glycosyl hydrolase 115 family protein [Jeotgalibaca caeni]
MTGFCLNWGTEIIYEGNIPPSIASFVQIFQRDLTWALTEGENFIANKIILSQASGTDVMVEQFQLNITEDHIQVFAKDERGFIYALLYISETYLGVDPLWFWNDVLPAPKNTIIIETGTYLSPIPKVRYRGWFINDEVLLAKWQYGSNEEEKWERIFETLLRCKGNMVIPGTDLSDPMPKQVASRMGLMLTHHHSEPLGAEMFARIYPDKNPSYTENKEFFMELWRKAIIEQQHQEVIWNIGFRGQGDRPFWADDPTFDTDKKRGALISEIIQAQYDLISQYQPNPICCVNLYGEVTDLYQKGLLSIPDQIIKVWADSGYGKMVSRRQGNHNPRSYSQPSENHTGLHGIYYHITFYDLQASNHLTIFPNTPAFIQQELTQSFDKNMDEYVIVNVGNIRPHLLYITLIREIWEKAEVDVTKLEETYVKRNFPEKYEEAQQAFHDYQAAILNYGEHLDERAGEQFYFYAIRYLAHAWLSGKKEGTDRLHWLTGEKSLLQQVEQIEQLLLSKKAQWEELSHRLLPITKLGEEGNRIYDQLYLPTSIHNQGLQALYYLCRGMKEWESKDSLATFMHLLVAQEQVTDLVQKMAFSTQLKWQDFYANDCLTNVSLAVEILETLSKYVRLVGDGPNFYSWEKAYLTDKGESAVMLLTNKSKQLSSTELYQRLKEKKSM